MAFTVKNISDNIVTLFGQAVQKRGTLNCSSHASNAEIVTSLKNGQLYKNLQGGAIAVVNVSDFNGIGATQLELDFWASCGFFSDLSKVEPKTPPNTVSETGEQLIKSLSYDEVLDADKVVRVNDLYPAIDEINVVNESSLIIGTHYLPSEFGIQMGSGYDGLCMQLDISGSITSKSTVTVQGTLNGLTWKDVTYSVMDDTEHAYLTGSVVSTAGGNLELLWSIYGHAWSKTRIKIVVEDNPTAITTLSIRKSKMGVA